jgi:tetratricopeptide (TPR) repeat protein
LSFFAAATAALYLFTAQQSVTVSGSLVTADGGSVGTYTVELTTISSHLPIDRTISSSDGKFEFRNLSSGNYTVFVKTERGDVVGFQDVSTAVLSGQLSIQIIEPRKMKPISGTVDAASLQHHPPRKAAQEMNRAIRAHEAGDSAAAQEHLIAAIRLDPAFSEAHTNLGAEYARGGKLDLAYSEFQTALQLGPKGAMQYCNLAVVALAMNRISEAEVEARQALALDSRSSQSNYILGKILGMQGHEEEAVRRLKLAAPDLPIASALLAKMQSSR